MNETSSYIAILRHGEYEQPKRVPSALLPHPLTIKGVGQAAGAAKKLQDFALQHQLKICPQIDSSKLLRAYETSLQIAEKLNGMTGENFYIHEYSALAERSVGAMANLTIDEIEAIMERDPRFQKPAEGWKSNSWYKLPFQGAESLMESGIRVAQHLQKRADEQVSSMQPHLKVIVGHGASLRHAALNLGLLKADDLPKFSMYHADPIFLKRTGHRWSLLLGEWKLRDQQREGID